MLQYHKMILDRLLKLEKQLIEDIKALPQEQVRSLKRLQSELAMMFNLTDTETNKLKLTASQRAAYERQLQNTVSMNVQKEKQYETQVTEAMITSYTINRISINSKVDFMGGITKIPFIDMSEINKIVSSEREGRKWVDRIGINKQAFEKEIMGEVDKFLSGNTSARDIQKIIRNKYGLNAYNAERLVRTEIASAQSQVNDLYARKQGVKTQFYMATLDSKTSKICQELDGTEWDIDDPKKPLPGIDTHPFCRSVLIDMPFPGWRPGTRRDGTEKNSIIPYQNYKDWYKDKEKATREYLDSEEKRLKKNTSSNKDDKIKLIEDLDKIKTSGLKEDEYKEYIQILNDNEHQSLRDLFSNHIEGLNSIKKLKGSGSYSPSSNAIKFDLVDREGMSKYDTLSHEIGHFMDHTVTFKDLNFKELDGISKIHVDKIQSSTTILKVASSSDEFLAAVRKDKEHLKGILDFNEREKLMKDDASAGVQDAIDGLFPRSRLRWGHGEKYYNRGYSNVEYFDKLFGVSMKKDIRDLYKDLGLEVKTLSDAKVIYRQYAAASEMWANITAAVVNGDGLKYVQEYLPNSYKAFLKIIEGAE